MSEKLKSQRQLLFSRVQKQKLSDSLSKNIDKLSRTQERLNSSRISQASSNSLQSLRRAYSTASIKKQRNSREKLLREILQKLKESKEAAARTQQALTGTANRKEVEAVVGEGGLSSRRPNRSKLEEMMKDIKKCNQLSTKAVYSIKKNISEELQGAQINSRQEASQSGHNSSILVLINELSAVKDELTKIKAENKELLGIVVDYQQEKEKEVRCPCQCHFSHK